MDRLVKALAGQYLIGVEPAKIAEVYGVKEAEISRAVHAYCKAQDSKLYAKLKTPKAKQPDMRKLRTHAAEFRYPH